MSRGLGRIEREILGTLEANELFDVPQLIDRIYKIELTEGNWMVDKRGRVAPIIPDACFVGMRRALRSLVRKGRIVRLGGFRGGWMKYANPQFAEQYRKEQEAMFAALRMRLRR